MQLQKGQNSQQSWLGRMIVLCFINWEFEFVIVSGHDKAVDLKFKSKELTNFHGNIFPDGLACHAFLGGVSRKSEGRSWFHNPSADSIVWAALCDNYH